MPRTYTGRKFSLPLFVTSNIATLGVLFGVFSFVAPSTWQVQMAASVLSFVLVFVQVHFNIAFVEFFVHRYVLHAPLVPFLKYFYRQHTMHHALTRVVTRKSLQNPKGWATIENVYPITEEHQHEASFFPWYTFSLLALVFVPFFVLGQWLLPDAPIFTAGFSALMWSILLYEIFHMLEHKPLSWWRPFLEHPRYGPFWERVYGFHLRHHLNVQCNESVSGFFGLPIPDWVFGTYVKFTTLYTHGTPASIHDFTPPKPRFIGWLDRAAERARKRRPKPRDPVAA